MSPSHLVLTLFLSLSRLKHYMDHDHRRLASLQEGGHRNPRDLPPDTVDLSYVPLQSLN